MIRAEASRAYDEVNRNNKAARENGIGYRTINNIDEDVRYTHRTNNLEISLHHILLHCLCFTATLSTTNTNDIVTLAE